MSNTSAIIFFFGVPAGAYPAYLVPSACRLQVTFLFCSVCNLCPTQTNCSITTIISGHTCRYDYGVVFFEFGNVFVSSGDLGLVQGPEAAHHSHPTLRCIHHGCCCWHRSHRLSYKYKQGNEQQAEKLKEQPAVGTDGAQSVVQGRP